MLSGFSFQTHGQKADSNSFMLAAKPSDLPVEQATKFEFIINLKAAKQIGLTIPVRVLERANQVIK